jgi:hypothetical protein
LLAFWRTIVKLENGTEVDDVIEGVVEEKSDYFGHENLLRELVVLVT